ncbi:hypothetical protein GGX14DRAFT_546951 [Mycena pura]|uniref:Uncharacterized protein n=1 Tax=Mycena pura TaxID=153505 RepID=A0AAD6UQP1_9AGAR|nr:hypothetical protein GGX14DRAFT_546951 [Mycena pura]
MLDGGGGSTVRVQQRVQQAQGAAGSGCSARGAQHVWATGAARTGRSLDTKASRRTLPRACAGSSTARDVARRLRTRLRERAPARFRRHGTAARRNILDGGGGSAVRERQARGAGGGRRVQRARAAGAAGAGCSGQRVQRARGAAWTRKRAGARSRERARARRLRTRLRERAPARFRWTAAAAARCGSSKHVVQRVGGGCSERGQSGARRAAGAAHAGRSTCGQQVQRARGAAAGQATASGRGRTGFRGLMR